MSRLSSNRHWTLILALGVCLAGSSLVVRHSCADPVMGTPADDQGGVGNGGPTGVGDPDVPDGAGRSKSIRTGGLSRGGNIYRNHAVGDGRIAGSRMVWRMYVAWIGNRNYWFHF